jgi:hypothetical protein
MRALFLSVLLAPALAVWADTAPDGVPQPPELPAAQSAEEAAILVLPPVAEETVVRQLGRVTVEEYRVQGRLQHTRITPRHGVSYYLEDRDGEGRHQRRSSDFDTDVVAPKILFGQW